MKKFVKKILSLIFPDRCLTCNCLISQDALFCLDHWQKLKFITDPKCRICSHPFEYSLENGQKLLCVDCLETKPFFDSSIAVFGYNEIIAKAIFDLKYNDATFLSKKIGEILAKKLENQVKDYDLIVAVPLYKKRLKKRKFNQSTLLCKAILKHHNHLKFYPDLLIRTKYNEAQAHLTQDKRIDNLRNAFEINPKFSDFIKGKKILLIDDVMTTGSTLNNCAKALKSKDSGDIKVAVIARTILRNKVI